MLTLDVISVSAGSGVGFMDMQIRQVQMRCGGPHWGQAAARLLLVKGRCSTGT